MFQVTKQQALSRWDKLPMILREAIFSERNADILWSVCETQHLSEDKIYKIANLTGDILMGFIHPEDLAREIKDAVGLNSEIAEIIAKEIDRKIFAPIKSEIDKASVLPLTSGEEIEKSEEIISDTGGLKMADIVKPEIKITRPKPAAAEPFKIIVADEGEKIIIPGSREAEPEISTPDEAMQITPEEPMVLHKEDAIKPVLGARKSLGDLFGHLLGRQSPIASNESLEQQKDSVSVAGQMEIGNSDANPSPFDIKGEGQIHTNDTNKEEKPKEARVVHYENVLRTPILETGEPKPILIDAEQREEAISNNANVELKEGKKPLEQPQNDMAMMESTEQQITEEEKVKAKVVNFSAETEVIANNANIIQNNANEIETSILKTEKNPKKKIFGFVKKLFKKGVVTDNANKEVIADNINIKQNNAESAKETILQAPEENLKKEEKPTEEIKSMEETKPIEETKSNEELKKKEVKNFIKSLFSKK